MYTQDKTQRITLRLNERQFSFVKETADMLGVSPSEFLRMVVNATMTSTDNAQAVMKAQGGKGRENDKADIKHLV